MRRKFLHNYADSSAGFSFRPHTQNDKKPETEKKRKHNSHSRDAETQRQISFWMRLDGQLRGFGSLGLGQATVMKQLQTISRQPSQTGPPVLCRLSTRVADDFVIVLGPRPFARTICLTDFVIYATQPKTTTGKTFAWMSWLIKLPSN